MILSTAIGLLAVFKSNSYEILRILVTSSTITTACICSIACAAFIERKDRKAIGLTGMVSCVIAAVLVIVATWVDPSEEFWKLTLTFVVIAGVLTHSLFISIPELEKKFVWIKITTVTFISVLGILLIFSILNEYQNIFLFRVILVVAIITLFGTVSIPIFSRITNIRKIESATLQLTLVSGNIYRDSLGNEFELKELGK